MSEKQKVKMKAVKCSTCGGTGKIVARASDGRKIGYDICPTCNGKGYVYPGGAR